MAQILPLKCDLKQKLRLSLPHLVCWIGKQKDFVEASILGEVGKQKPSFIIYILIQGGMSTYGEECLFVWMYWDAWCLFGLAWPHISGIALGDFTPNSDFKVITTPTRLAVKSFCPFPALPPFYFIPTSFSSLVYLPTALKYTHLCFNYF